MSTSGPYILLGISGSIAAYKSPLLLRLFQERGLDVRVVMTPSAAEFVSPLVLSNLSKHAVVRDMFDEQTQRDGSWHIHLARDSAALVIAPASAKTLASLAYGLSDTALSVVAMALPPQTPLVIAPAMDTEMWEHPATQANIELLRKRGAHIIDPEIGKLASGLYGKGRLADIQVIVKTTLELLPNDVSSLATTATVTNATQQRSTEKDPRPSEAASLQQALNRSSLSLDQAAELNRLQAELDLLDVKLQQRLQPLVAKRVLITAGPTREPIDDVRFLSNYSSGKMGFALAEAAAKAGANVILISGPVHLSTPAKVQRIDVESAQQMLNAVQQHSDDYDLAIACAAVADYAPQRVASKLKKSQLGDEFDLHLQATPDILRWLGETKKQGQVVVGFALESENEVQYGTDKLRKKKCDMIVVNSSKPDNSAIASDENQITLVWNEEEGVQSQAMQRMSKFNCALTILEYSSRMLH